MSKKFMAQRARDASNAKKAVEVSAVSEPTAFGVFSRPTHRSEDRERAGTERVTKFMAMSLEDLELARIEHESAILDMDLQMVDYASGHLEGEEAGWAERTTTARRYRKVALAIIQHVIELRKGQGASRAEFFMAAAVKLFDAQDLKDVWAAARAIAPSAHCWLEG